MLTLTHGKFLLNQPDAAGRLPGAAVLTSGVHVDTRRPVWAVCRVFPDEPCRVLVVSDDREEASWALVRARGFEALARYTMTDAQRDELAAVLPSDRLAGETDAAFSDRLLNAADHWFRATFGRGLLDMAEEAGVAFTLAEALDNPNAKAN